MEYFKRVLAVLLILCLSLSALAGCNTSDTPPSESVQPTGSALPPVEETTLDDELQRAQKAGFIMDGWLGDMEQTITFAEYCTIVGNYVSAWDSDRLAEWETKAELAAVSEEPMDTEDGFLLLSYLWIMIGYETPQLLEGMEPWAGGDNALRDTQTEFLSWDYPLFPDSDKLAYPEYQSNYIWGGVQVLPDVVSAVSGERIFPYDAESNSLHLDKPLSRDTAVRALLRLSEYCDGMVFAEIIDKDILPDHADTDFAVGSPFQNGEASLMLEFVWEYPSSPTEYIVDPVLNMSFDLLLPNELIQMLSQQLAELRCAVDLIGTDNKEINRAHDDPCFNLHLQDGAVYAVDQNSQEFSAVSCGNYWRIPISTKITYLTKTALSVNAFAPHMTLYMDGYEGRFFVNDLDISSGGKQVIFCDFDFETAYGQPAREQFRFGVTDERLISWEAVDQIGQTTVANALRMGVRFTGEPYEPKSEAFLDGIDTSLLHNPEHDWRDWGGLTCWWHLDGHTDLPIKLEYGIVIPREITYADDAETTGITLNGSFGFGSYNAFREGSNQELKEYEVPNINIYPSQNGNTTFNTWGNGNISVTAYNDCYYVRYSGETEVSDMDYTLSVIKLSWTGDAAVYSGYFYLTDFSLYSEGETVLSYCVGEDTPSELFHCYNHGTNGSYYYWNDLGSSNYHLGLDTLSIK